MDRARELGHAHVYGSSVEGRDLLAVRVCRDADLDAPVVVVTAGIHGLEYIGVQAALRVLELGPLPGLQLWVCPVLNPDGYAHTWRTQGRAPVGLLRKNAQGVDLNRNFPLPWSARPSRWKVAGSHDPLDATFRGPAPLSEPETHHLATWLEAVAPRGSVNFHSFMGTLICARVWHPSDWFTYGRLCGAFREGQGGPLGYLRLGTPLFDVFTGELEDWQHHVLGCWATCVECFSLVETMRQHWSAPTAFWRFNPREPDPIASRDASGARRMLVAMAATDRPPHRPGAATTLAAWGPRYDGAAPASMHRLPGR